MNQDAPQSAGDLGEFALIERLRGLLSPDVSAGDVIVGNGDDAAVVDAGGGKCWVLTCDVQVQGEHFPRKGISGYSVGQKALAVNISDIAAMGGAPRFAIVSLGIPAKLPVSFLDELYEGINAKAGRWDVLVLGGNISRTEGPFFIDVFVLGEIAREEILLRSGAQPGDQILVTGYLGDAAAGLHLIRHPELKVRDETHTVLTFAQLRPQPRVEEGRAIAKLRLAHSMMDLSDGLVGDLGHLCKASGVGALIWENALPISGHMLDLATISRIRPADWALHGGEDYELLLTAPVEHVSELQKAVREGAGAHLTPIGEVLPPGEGILLKKGETTVPLEAKTWDHFRSPRDEPDAKKA
ncbi:MAG: thiamine-phosphate kinase [bacterium]|nr:thiamine-phosphate kinase [bacterium]